MQRLLAAAGLGSRRGCEELVRQGRVSINGRRASLGALAGPDDVVLCDGKPLPAPRRPAYILLHKPPGYVVTRHDPAGRPTVMDLVPRRLRVGVFPVGRLDLPSEGLLLLTNDGELANRLLHPRYGVTKIYLVWVAGSPSPAIADRAAAGVRLADGVVKPKIRLLSRWTGGGLLEVALREGKKREVRRIGEALGLRVVRLKRVAFGPLRLGKLARGRTRTLSPAEISSLRQATGLDGTDRGGP